MSCSHTTSCELFVQFVMNPALDLWKTRYCEGDFKRCSRFQTSNKGSPVPVTLLPNGKNISVNRSDEDLGATALFNAIEKHRPRMVSALLRTGINVNVRNVAGITPLMAAADLGSDDIVRVLLEHGADPGIKDMDGETAYDLAARKGHNLVMALLGKTQSLGGKSV